MNELPLRLAKDRLKLVIGLAQYLQTGLQMARAKRGEPRLDPPPADTRQ